MPALGGQKDAGRAVLQHLAADDQPAAGVAEAGERLQESGLPRPGGPEHRRGLAEPNRDREIETALGKGEVDLDIRGGGHGRHA